MSQNTQIMRNIDGIVQRTSQVSRKTRLRPSFHLPQFTKKIKNTFSFLLLFLVLTGVGVWLSFNMETVKGATYGWLQDDWSGGTSSDAAVHANNQAGWNKYESQTGLVAGETLSLIREDN